MGSICSALCQTSCGMQSVMQAMRDPSGFLPVPTRRVSRSQSLIAGPAFRKSTSRICLRLSIGSIPPAARKPAAWAWDWRSSEALSKHVRDLCDAEIASLTGWKWRSGCPPPDCKGRVKKVVPRSRLRYQREWVLNEVLLSVFANGRCRIFRDRPDPDRRSVPE